MRENEGMFYTYLHLRNDSHKVFYVGKGKGPRAYRKNDRSQHWKNIVAKHGYTVQIVANFQDEKDSFASEIELIAKLKTEGHPLINISRGGDGAAGHVHSSETKAKRAATLARPDIKEKISRARHRGKNHYAARSILCLETGNTFETVKDAKQWLCSIGIQNPSGSALSKACNGRFNKIYKFTWRYADKKGNRAKYVDRRRKRKILCIETKINFSSIREALDWLKSNGYPKASSTALSGAASGKRRQAYSYRWQYITAARR